MKVSIYGITGYTGSILYNLLKKHPQISQIKVYQHDIKKPQKISTLNKRLIDSKEDAYPYDPLNIMNTTDLLFLATPAGVSQKLAQPYLDADFPIIDLSGDFRLKNPQDYEQWYKKVSTSKENLSKSYYGLADLKNNFTNKYIANPGCYATATLLGLAPLVKNRMIEEASILVDAKSGLSGAGKSFNLSNHFIQANENLQVYKANQHQHIPEILQELQSWNPDIKQLQFMTTLVPIDRGIMSSIYVKINPQISEKEIFNTFKTTYESSQFVKFQNENLPDIKSVINTNDCRIGITFNPKNRYLLVVSVIDNMIKGAAGQAIQNFNQLFNFPSKTGLDLNPTAL